MSQPSRPSRPSRTAMARDQIARSRRVAADVMAELTDDDERTPLAEVPTASSRGLLSCHACDLVNPITLEGEPCPRCGATLHRRKPASLARTWAFLLAAYILYIPANLLPVMVTESILGVQRDTILSGVLYLWLSGSHMLAGVVLIASIVVPLLKMMILTLLLISVHMKSTWRIRQQTKLYGLVEVIGRWSMLDIFVVALLASLVRAGALATIIPGAGALAFASVVVMTMLASLSFDPRLLWDSLETPNPSSIELPESDNARSR
ncbi:MAG: paraquat-inducible protein A [Pseudomonadota bacterium]